MMDHNGLLEKLAQLGMSKAKGLMPRAGQIAGGVAGGMLGGPLGVPLGAMGGQVLGSGLGSAMGAIGDYYSGMGDEEDDQNPETMLEKLMSQLSDEQVQNIFQRRFSKRDMSNGGGF